MTTAVLRTLNARNLVHLRKCSILFNLANEARYASLSLPVHQKAKSVAEKSYFDTNLLITELKNNGFDQKQAETLCGLFKEVTYFVVSEVRSDCVTKSHQELSIQQLMVHIASLKKDMIILEKSEFSALRNENEKIMMELKTLREQMGDEVIKLKSGFTLDLNLEKSKTTETDAQMDIRHQKLQGHIDMAIANLKASMEKQKLDLIKYGVATVFSIITVGATIFRIFKLL